MFAIISGLEHRTVKRLKETWKQIPEKYIKSKDDMFCLMDPSMNFRKYRNLIQNTKVWVIAILHGIITTDVYKWRSILVPIFYILYPFLQPPKIPIYPMVCKDLIFIDLGNDTKIENLINFEKLRMLSKEVRIITI